MQFGELTLSGQFEGALLQLLFSNKPARYLPFSSGSTPDVALTDPGSASVCKQKLGEVIEQIWS